jgi:hypothetical protein
MNFTLFNEYIFDDIRISEEAGYSPVTIPVVKKIKLYCSQIRVTEIFCRQCMNTPADSTSTVGMEYTTRDRQTEEVTSKNYLYFKYIKNGKSGRPRIDLCAVTYVIGVNIPYIS